MLLLYLIKVRRAKEKRKKEKKRRGKTEQVSLGKQHHRSDDWPATIWTAQLEREDDPSCKINRLTLQPQRQKTQRWNRSVSLLP